MLSRKTIPGNFAAKILKTRRAKRKNKTKARGELFASGSRVVFAILIPAKLTHIWRTTCLRIAWRISRMHDRKLNGCRQRLPFARHFIPRKCSLCSQSSIHADWSDRLTMLVRVGKRVDLQPFKIRASNRSTRSHDVRLETSMRCSTSFTDTLWKTKNGFFANRTRKKPTNQKRLVPNTSNRTRPKWNCYCLISYRAGAWHYRISLQIASSHELG